MKELEDENEMLKEKVQVLEESSTVSLNFELSLFFTYLTSRSKIVLNCTADVECGFKSVLALCGVSP